MKKGSKHLITQDKDNNNTIAHRIKTLREYKNLTQEDLAKKAGYSDKSSISKIESSGNNISLKKISKIAAALDVSPENLLGTDESSQKAQSHVAKERNSLEIPPDLQESLDKFSNLLIDYKKDLDETRNLVNEFKEKETYRRIGESFDKVIDEIDDKRLKIEGLFSELKNALDDMPTTKD